MIVFNLYLINQIAHSGVIFAVEYDFAVRNSIITNFKAYKISIMAKRSTTTKIFLYSMLVHDKVQSCKICFSKFSQKL